MKSLRIRIFALIAGVILLFGAAIMLLNWGCLTSFYYWQSRQSLKNSVAAIASAIPDSLTYTSDEFANIEEQYTVDITIYLENGDIVYMSALREFDPRSDYSGAVRYHLDELNRTEIVSCDYDSDTSRFEIQRSCSGDTQYIAYRAKLDDRYYVVVRMSIDMLRTSASVANSFMLISVALMLIVALVSSIIIAGHLSKPIAEMNTTTRAMSRFDFTHRVNIKGKDEIAQLGESINVLSDNTSALLTELNEKNAALEKELKRVRAMEQMSKEFVSNVSHELKTPIAIIQGYAEGLRLNIASDEERRAMYCDIIESESYKMDKLVKELLELSRLESGQADITPVVFDVTEMLNEVISRISSITDDVHIVGEYDDGPRLGYADEMRMGQVLANYINNAVSHTTGEKLVKIAVEQTDACYRISVFNTGDGIPEELLRSIWQSFYRGDQSRSRENGNAGLGLSIVSTIMRHHGQQYGVYNTDGGVVFWYDIRIAEETSDE